MDRLPKIDPPVLNSASPWATTFEDIQTLLECPYTGAVTTRTCTLEGFADTPSLHQFVFFDPRDNSTSGYKNRSFNASDNQTGSLNTLGYSPLPLRQYLSIIQMLTQEKKHPLSPLSLQDKLNPNAKDQILIQKPIIISVTGSPDEVVQAWRLITYTIDEYQAKLCMEINLSCPNIPNAPPPAYDASALFDYLRRINDAIVEHSNKNLQGERRARYVPLGIKLSPYTFQRQYEDLISALLKSCSRQGPSPNYEIQCPISFITTTNTLGSSLLMDHVEGSSEYRATLLSTSNQGIGGLGGTPIHPLSLGNVHTLRKLLDKHPELSSIDIIGVGGVCDAAGMARMRAAGAVAVGVATALGRDGVGVFEKICHPFPGLPKI